MKMTFQKKFQELIKNIENGRKNSSESNAKKILT
jgi:hypothetical protein